MRVAIVQEHLDVRRGGAETSVAEMARALAAQGCDVSLVCAGGPDDVHASAAEADAVENGPAVVRIPVAGGSRLRRTIQFVGGADSHCRNAGYDIVHAVTPCFSCNVYQPRGGTYVETVRRSVELSDSPLARLIKWLGRRFHARQRFLLELERNLLSDRRPPYVAAVSEYVRRQVEQAFPGFPSQRLAVVFNGVEIAPLDAACAAAARTALRQRLGVAEGAPLALFVAHNFKLKGLAELLSAQATQAGRQAGWALVVAGRDRRAPYERMAARLGSAARVHFVGADAAMSDLYAAADVLAHPTWYDPCSRVALEALCCGLPVVTTRFNGAAEALEEGRTGFAIESPRDVEALARAITASLHPAVRESCRARMLTLREQLSMSRHASELRLLYEGIMQNK